MGHHRYDWHMPLAAYLGVQCLAFATSSCFSVAQKEGLERLFQAFFTQLN